MIDRRALRTLVELALAEDMPHGDVTSNAFLPVDAWAVADLEAREAGVLSGSEVFEAVMQTVDPLTEVKFHLADGEQFAAGAKLAEISGPARSVLSGERVALNLTQRMCGIATLTRAHVEAAGPGVRVADTRKTTPGLRMLERHAVRSGGGHNHRHSLSDAVMAKDNHLALVDDVTTAIKAARAALPHTTHIEVEVDRIDQMEAVLAGGVDTIMLDNFTLDELREGVRIVAGRAIVEASGNVSLTTISDIAATGVDVISVGALTHSARNLDLGLDVRIRQEVK